MRAQVVEAFPALDQHNGVGSGRCLGRQARIEIDRGLVSVTAVFLQNVRDVGEHVAQEFLPRAGAGGNGGDDMNHGGVGSFLFEKIETGYTSAGIGRNVSSETLRR